MRLNPSSNGSCSGGNACARFGANFKGDDEVVNVVKNNGTDSHIIGRTLKARNLFDAVAEVQEIAGKCSEKGYRDFADCVYVTAFEDGTFFASVHHFHNVSFSKYSHSAGYDFSVFEKGSEQIFNEDEASVSDLFAWCEDNNIDIGKAGVACCTD